MECRTRCQASDSRSVEGLRSQTQRTDYSHISWRPLGRQRTKPLAGITNGLSLFGREVAELLKAFAESFLPRTIILIYKPPLKRETRPFTF